MCYVTVWSSLSPLLPKFQEVTFPDIFSLSTRKEINIATLLESTPPRNFLFSNESTYKGTPTAKHVLCHSLEQNITFASKISGSHVSLHFFFEH